MTRHITAIEAIDDTTAEILRKKTPAQRLDMTFRMWDFARDLITNVLRQEHPEWSQQEVHRETVRRLSHGAI